MKTVVRKQKVALFVDRTSQRWIVRDPEGNYWHVASIDNAWDHREPFHPSEETVWEPVPEHYKNLLGLPF
jgi:hypothetical protein